MSEDIIRPADPTAGQATAAPESQGAGPSESTAAPQTPSEQAPVSTQTKEQQEQFFADYNSLPDEVKTQIEPYYKQMQADYTRKTQRLSKKEKEYLQKVQAYDQFTSNPVQNLAQLAQQYGYSMTPVGAQPQQQKQQPAVTPDWTPNTWEDVFGKSAEFLKPQFEQMLQEAVNPYQQEINYLKQQLGTYQADKVEAQFNQIDPEWRQYEDDMRDLLMEHPTLAKDPKKLFKLVIPEEKLKTKYYQEALKDLEKRTQAAKIESSGRSQPTKPQAPKFNSFDDAFKDAWNKHGRK